MYVQEVHKLCSYCVCMYIHTVQITGNVAHAHSWLAHHLHIAMAKHAWHSRGANAHILKWTCVTLIIVAHMEVDTSEDSSANLCSSRDNRLSQRIAINARRDGDTGKQFDDYW